MSERQTGWPPRRRRRRRAARTRGVSTASSGTPATASTRVLGALRRAGDETRVRPGPARGGGGVHGGRAREVHRRGRRRALHPGPGRGASAQRPLRRQARLAAGRRDHGPAGPDGARLLLHAGGRPRRSVFADVAAQFAAHRDLRRAGADAARPGVPHRARDPLPLRRDASAGRPAAAGAGTGAAARRRGDRAPVGSGPRRARPGRHSRRRSRCCRAGERVALLVGQGRARRAGRGRRHRGAARRRDHHQPARQAVRRRDAPARRRRDGPPGHQRQRRRCSASATRC